MHRSHQPCLFGCRSGWGFGMLVTGFGIILMGVYESQRLAGKDANFGQGRGRGRGADTAWPTAYHDMGWSGAGRLGVVSFYWKRVGGCWSMARISWGFFLVCVGG